MTDHLEQRIQAALRRPDEPPPSSLLARIHESRASGYHIVLPAGRQPTLSRPALYLRILVAAAASLTLLILTSQLTRPHAKTGPGMPVNAVSMFAIGDYAFADQVGGSNDTVPRYEPVPFSSDRIRPVTLRYVNEVLDHGSLSAADSVTVSIARASGSDSDWIVSSMRRFSERMPSVTYIEVDSLWVDRVSLSPRKELRIFRASDGNGYSLRQTFQDTAVVRRVQSHVVTASSDRSRPSQLDKGKLDTVVIVQDTILRRELSRYHRASGDPDELPFFMMAINFRAGMTGSFVYAVPGGVIRRLGERPMNVMPVDLQVIGSERTQGPTGSVDCWLVRSGTGIVQYWIRKSDGVLIRRLVTPNVEGTSHPSRIQMTLLGEK